MTPDQASEALDNLAKLIAENIPDITQTMALTGKALVQERIQEGGLSSELVSFPAYSKRYKKYKGKKQGEGATSFRNLTLSGDMWRKTGIKSAGNTSKGYEVIIGGTTEDAQDKINWNADKDGGYGEVGDFLSLSKDEQLVLVSDYDAELDKLIAESGLS